ncbi:MAG: hypothetical protein J6T00_03555, partial [Bacteroidaceae bacterium]|nr:hypothetical protein [Bacteroidaceae bacterium]
MYKDISFAKVHKISDLTKGKEQNNLSFASSTFEGQGARSGGQEECSVRLFAIFVCMSKVSSCSLLLAPCS